MYNIPEGWVNGIGELGKSGGVCDISADLRYLHDERHDTGLDAAVQWLYIISLLPLYRLQYFNAKHLLCIDDEDSIAGSESHLRFFANSGRHYN